MGDHTGIEWTEATWNPTVGCSIASPGCDACYAAREAAGRLAHLPAYKGLAIRPPGERARFTGEVRQLPERLDQPLRWRRPRRIFVNSMSDLFHPEVPLAYIERVWAVMEQAPRHQFQILTKRPARMANLLDERLATPEEVDAGYELGIVPGLAYDRVLPNVWLGTSIESDAYSWRAAHVRRTPAAVRWISAEPLLGPLPGLDLTGIDWLVIGAESGPGARPMDLGWARELVAMADEAGTAVFVKQITEGIYHPRVAGHPVKDPTQFPADLRRRSYPDDEPL